MTPERLTTGDTEAVVDVLTDAFAGYPVMCYVLDGRADASDPRLRTLVGFFVRARVWRDHPVLGVRDGGDLVAVATITPPVPGPVPPALTGLRDAVWTELGDGARERYEAFGRACERFAIDEAHHHLNMIGVRSSHQGRGLARPLLDAVHDLADDDPGSAGVTLSTEAPANLPLYERFGYRRVGHETVADELETWGFWRPSERSVHG
mgnify:CR=1 FL=1